MEETKPKDQLDLKEMEIFQTVRKNIAKMGFAPNRQGKINRYQCIMIVIFFIDLTILSVFFFHEASGLEAYMDVIIEFIAEFGMFVAFVSLIFRNDDIFYVVELTEIELKSRLNRSEASRAIFANTNRIVEFLSKLVGVVALLLIPVFILPNVITSYYVYFTTEAGNDAFKLSFQTWFPFNWHNPIGYLVGVMWQTTIACVEFSAMALVVVPIPFGAFIFALSFTRDWKNDLRTLNEMTKSKQTKEQYHVQIAEFIRTHSKVKQLANVFLNVYEVIIFAAVMFSGIALCVIMLMIEIEIISKDISNPQVLWKTICYTFLALILVFLSCEIGQRLTDAFNDITDRFERLDWYLFPVEIQRLLPTIIMNAHVPIVINCFGVVEGSREQFKRVVNVVYKTFNVLREIFA